MNKLSLLVLCIAVYQLAAAAQPRAVWGRSLSEEIDETEDDESQEDVDEERAFWSNLFGKSLDLLKKSIKLRPLICEGTSCVTCISANIPAVVNKSGCITISYSRSGTSGILSFSLDSASKQVWAGSVPAGRAIPSCVTLPAPVKEICMQDVTASAGKNGQGDLCFTVNFKTYGVGAKFCAAFRGGSLVPSVVPKIVRT